MNIVPKTGGNAIQGSVYFSGTGEKLQSDNFTQELKDAGLAAPTPFTKVYDLNGAFGGPIKKDRVWYFVNARTQGSTTTVANIYYNQNAGDPTKWTYVPDLSQPAYSDRTWENVSGRVTWQATARNKISGFWDEQWICRKCTGMTQGLTDPARVTPEAIGVGSAAPLRVRQITWSSPLTNRLLLDAGYGGHVLRRGQPRTDPEPDAGSHSRRRTVRERLRRERRYSGPDLPLAGLGRQLAAARTTGAHRSPTSPARTA